MATKKRKRKPKTTLFQELFKMVLHDLSEAVHHKPVITAEIVTDQREIKRIKEAKEIHDGKV